jgi:hypothetical protein
MGSARHSSGGTYIQSKTMKDAIKGSDAIILTNEDAHIQMLRRMMHGGARTFCLCHD